MFSNNSDEVAQQYLCQKSTARTKSPRALFRRLIPTKALFAKRRYTPLKLLFARNSFSILPFPATLTKRNRDISVSAKTRDQSSPREQWRRGVGWSSFLKNDVASLSADNWQWWIDVRFVNRYKLKRWIALVREEGGKEVGGSQEQERPFRICATVLLLWTWTPERSERERYFA